MEDELESGHDPLDALFESGEASQEAAAGEETQIALMGDATQEASAGEDAIEGEPADDKVKMVPLAALEESRQRTRDAEAALAVANKPKETVAEEPSTGFPDPNEDPAGFVQFMNINTKLDLSEDMARDKHGDELIDKVRDWAMKRFESDPTYAQKVLFAPNPYKVAVTDYNEVQNVERLKGLPPEVLEGLDEEELALLKAHRAGKSGNSEQAGSTSEGVQTPRSEGGQFAPRSRSADPPPRSLASEASSSGKPMTEPAVGGGAAFDSVFGI